MAEERTDLPPGASPINGLPPPVHTRWKKGQSGNPGGRPRGKSLVALMREVLDRELHGRPLSEVLAERIIKEALSGKHPFVKEVLDRLEGPVNQRHEVKQDNAVRIIVADARGHEREGSFDDITDYMHGINVPEREVSGLRQFYNEYRAGPPAPLPPPCGTSGNLSSRSPCEGGAP